MEENIISSLHYSLNISYVATLYWIAGCLKRGVKELLVRGPRVRWKEVQR
jgi:hypothetical protein